jgi:hypothetical protein
VQTRAEVDTHAGCLVRRVTQARPAAGSNKNGEAARTVIVDLDPWACSQGLVLIGTLKWACPRP